MTTTLLGELHDFVPRLTPEIRAALDAASSQSDVAEGGRLLRAGSVPAKVYQIIEGRVRYSAWDHRGNEKVLTYMTCGDWVGLSEVFTRLPAQWDVIAQSPLRVRTIRRRDFEHLVGEHSLLAKQLLRVFALRFSLHRLFDMDHSTLSLKERVIKMLWFLSYGHDKDSDDRKTIVLRLSQEELGKVVGISRQKLNPVLKTLEREGLLSIGFGCVSLKSRASFRSRYAALLEIGA